jgi:hypothetical protein
MRTFALTTIAAVAALNGLLGYCGQRIADSMVCRLQTYGATLPAVTAFALALPPYFYLLGIGAGLVAILGFWRPIAEYKLFAASFGLLFLDIGILLASHYAFTLVATRM